MNPAQKSAVLMLSIGEENAAEVMRHLNQNEVEAISLAMGSVYRFSREQIDEVLKNFHSDIERHLSLNVNVNEYLYSILSKVMGAENATNFIEGLINSGSRKGIETLDLMEPSFVADLIRDEHPQIVATILVHLKRTQAADILEHFEEEKRHNIMLRIATFGGVQPEALQELNEVLNQLLHGQNLKRNKIGGVRPAAEIINLMKSKQESALLEKIRHFDEELAQKIIEEMFLFENLFELEDAGIQRILQDVDMSSLAIALKGSHEDLRDKFLRNMSSRQAEILREDIESLKPIRVSQVENEQKRIIALVRQLLEQEEIVINSSDDTYV